MDNFWQNDPGKETFIEPFTLSIYKYDPMWLHSPLAHFDSSLPLFPKLQNSELLVNLN